MNPKEKLGMFLLLGIVALVLIMAGIRAANSIGGNYKNVTVITTVQITNSKPEIISLYVYPETNYTFSNVTLNAGSTRQINCNATVRDWNGPADIAMVNATLWHAGNSTYEAANDNNSHYTNSNCTNTGIWGNYTANYVCTFNVYYYANNGTWNCTAYAVDTFNKTGNRTNSTSLLPLYALNVTEGINYGNVAVESDSLTQTANITNFGNMPINISLEGYGIVRGDGLAMNCSLSGNISIQNERFSLSDTGLWIDKIALTSSPQIVSNLTLIKQTSPASPVINTTYWQLHIAPNPSGNCSGYVIFSAEAS